MKDRTIAVAGPLDLPRTSEVVVVGAGVMGASCAYALAGRGMQVTVIERDGIAAGASGRNCGIIGARSHYASGLTPYLAVSLEMLQRWPEELEADFSLRHTGSLLVTVDPDGPAGLLRTEETSADPAFPVMVLDSDEARRLVPALSPLVTGGVYFPRNGHVWPFALNHALADAAMRRGARVVAGVTVTAVEVASERVRAVDTTAGRITCRWVVNAANAWAGPLARTVGLDIPIQPQRGQILATLTAPPLLPMPLDYDAGGSPLYWRQTPRGNVVMGGGRSWDRGGIGSFDRANTFDTLCFFASRIAALTPAVRELTVVRTWGGTMGFTPDYCPVIGEAAAIPGFVMAHACNGSGLPWAPIVGRLVAEIVTGAAPSLPLEPVSPDRFASAAVRR